VSSSILLKVLHWQKMLLKHMKAVICNSLCLTLQCLKLHQSGVYVCDVASLQRRE